MILFRKPFRLLFKYLIFIYIIIFIVLYFRQNATDFMQNTVVQKIQKTVEKQFQESDLKMYDHKQEMPLPLESLPKQFYEENVPVYSGAIQVTSGVTFKMITSMDEGWRKKSFAISDYMVLSLVKCGNSLHAMELNGHVELLLRHGL